VTVDRAEDDLKSLHLRAGRGEEFTRRKDRIQGKSKMLIGQRLGIYYEYRVESNGNEFLKIFPIVITQAYDPYRSLTRQD